jgi:beta-glucosidase-like glycosyl hydrolase
MVAYRRGKLPAPIACYRRASVERTLHEIYLDPFRSALVRYGVAGLRGSYNRLNGRYTCQDPDLLDIPRTQWSWAGLTVPDFLFAVRDPRPALEAGLDLPALGSDSQLTREDLLANEERLDAIALHVLTAVEYGTKANAGVLRSAAARERISGEGRCHRGHGAAEERRIAPSIAH